jgi:tetrachlorobenzoquinone reductase
MILQILISNTRAAGLIGMEDSFEVRLQRSGRTIVVPPGKTILRTLIEAGVDVDFSCAMGGCGTCETRIVEGIPDHRDLYLTDEEKSGNKVIMICCSRSKTPVLVLDL